MAFAAGALPVLGVLAAGATVIGTGLAIAGTIADTNAKVAADQYQAQIADRQAAIDKENAIRAVVRSQQEQQDQDRKSAFVYGQIVAAQSASGLSLGGRSQMLTRKSAKELARVDALNIRQAGDLEAQNYMQNSEDSAAAAGFARSQANSSQLAGWIGIGSSIVGGAGKLANTFSYASPKIGSAYSGGWGSTAFAG